MSPENPSSFHRFSIFSLLNGNNYQMYNRNLAKRIGLETTIFLSELIDKIEHFQKINSIPADGWIYLTYEDVYERTALSRRDQERAINKLIELKFIEMKLKGSPPKRHFRLIQENFTILLDMTYQDVTSDMLICKKRQIAPYIEETKEETKKNPPLPPPQSSDPKTHFEKMKKIFLKEGCTEEEFQELWKRYLSKPDGIVINFRKWAKSVLLSIRDDEVKRKEKRESMVLQEKHENVLRRAMKEEQKIEQARKEKKEALEREETEKRAVLHKQHVKNLPTKPKHYRITDNGIVLFKAPWWGHELIFGDVQFMQILKEYIDTVG